MAITDQEKVTLFQLMAKATAAREDFGYDYLDVLITIGQGMFWSQELDDRARWLAKDVSYEFERRKQ